MIQRIFWMGCLFKILKDSHETLGIAALDVGTKLGISHLDLIIHLPVPSDVQVICFCSKGCILIFPEDAVEYVVVFSE